MKTIVPTQEFSGFPHGVERDNPDHDEKRADDPRYAEKVARRPETFVAGKEYEVAEAFADMVVEKGLAKVKGGAAAKDEPEEDEAPRKRR